jgi:hypothetical protein
MVKKALVGVAVCATAVVGLGVGSASAGEITGTGKPLLVTVDPNTLNGRSECAFSGLNDGFFDGSEAERVQSFGQIVRVAGPLGGIPGFACNPARALR